MEKKLKISEKSNAEVFIYFYKPNNGNDDVLPFQIRNINGMMILFF
jgi:hypothetical protein